MTGNNSPSTLVGNIEIKLEHPYIQFHFCQPYSEHQAADLFYTWKIWKKVSIYLLLERKHKNQLKERKLRRLSIDRSVMDWFPLDDLQFFKTIRVAQENVLASGTKATTTMPRLAPAEPRRVMDLANHLSFTISTLFRDSRAWKAVHYS